MDRIPTAIFAEDRNLIVTPAMRAKVDELIDLILGALPGYKVADITLRVTKTHQPPVVPEIEGSSGRSAVSLPAPSARRGSPGCGRTLPE